MDFIISIDEEIPTGSLSTFRIIAQTRNGYDTLKVDYYPGSLNMDSIDYSRLLDSSAKSIYLAFSYVDREGKYDYKIELKKRWLEQYFFILRIYNTTKKKYKKMFSQNDATRLYVYEFDYPGGATRLIRKTEKFTISSASRPVFKRFLYFVFA